MTAGLAFIGASATDGSSAADRCSVIGGGQLAVQETSRAKERHVHLLFSVLSLGCSVVFVLLFKKFQLLPRSDSPVWVLFSCLKNVIKPAGPRGYGRPSCNYRRLATSAAVCVALLVVEGKKKKTSGEQLEERAHRPRQGETSITLPRRGFGLNR